MFHGETWKLLIAQCWNCFHATFFAGTIAFETFRSLPQMSTKSKANMSSEISHHFGSLWTCRFIMSIYYNTSSKLFFVPTLPSTRREVMVNSHPTRLLSAWQDISKSTRRTMHVLPLNGIICHCHFIKWHHISVAGFRAGLAQLCSYQSLSLVWCHL